MDVIENCHFPYAQPASVRAMNGISDCSLDIAYVPPINMSWPVTYFSLHNRMRYTHVTVQSDISDWSKDIGKTYATSTEQLLIAIITRTEASSSYGEC